MNIDIAQGTEWESFAAEDFTFDARPLRKGETGAGYLADEAPRCNCASGSFIHTGCTCGNPTPRTAPQLAKDNLFRTAAGV